MAGKSEKKVETKELSHSERLAKGDEHRKEQAEERKAAQEAKKSDES